jgi:hypothetical protein
MSGDLTVLQVSPLHNVLKKKLANSLKIVVKFSVALKLELKGYSYNLKLNERIPVN